MSRKRIIACCCDEVEIIKGSSCECSDDDDLVLIVIKGNKSKREKLPSDETGSCCGESDEKPCC